MAIINRYIEQKAVAMAVLNNKDFDSFKKNDFITNYCGIYHNKNSFSKKDDSEERFWSYFIDIF